MTRSPASTSASGASPATSLLKSLLRRADQSVDPVFHFDEVRRWPEGALNLFVALGVVRAIEPAAHVQCDGCADGHRVEVDIREYPHGVIGVASCPECGLVTVPLERLSQWGFDFAGLAAVVSRAAACNGHVTVEVADRVAYLGRIESRGESLDFFLGRGLCWPDAADVMNRSTRLRASSSPAVLTLNNAPERAASLPVRPAFATLTDSLSIEDAHVGIDLGYISAQTVVPHSEAKGEPWLTVTRAAEKLMDVVSGVDLKKARARVSAAASRDEFRTNGKLRGERRIHRDTFSTWLMKQRERDLARADADGW